MEKEPTTTCREETEMANISLQNIEKSFEGKRVIDGLTVNVKEGQMISLLGPSGCGKTTTLKIIAGLLAPDGGDILFDGKSIKSIPAQKREAVIVFQDHRLFPHMTVKKNIEFGLKMRGVSKEDRQAVSLEMLKLVRLEEHGDKYPEELSGGQKQRVAIARALAVKPRVLLLDEPFSNLDLRLREEMREFISRLQKELGITTVMVTHDKSDALITSDVIAVMMGGQLKQVGSPEELYERPNSVEVANFFGDINILDIVSYEKNSVQTELGSFDLKVEGDIDTIAFRPEDLMISNDGYNFMGKVIDKKYAGERINYKLKVCEREIKYVDLQKNNLQLEGEYPFRVQSEKLLTYRRGEG